MGTLVLCASDSERDDLNVLYHILFLVDIHHMTTKHVYLLVSHSITIRVFYQQPTTVYNRLSDYSDLLLGDFLIFCL